MKKGLRRAVVDYKREPTRTKVGSSPTRSNIVYVYKLQLECGHSITVEKYDPGAPQFGSCGQCEPKPTKYKRSTLSSRFV